MVEPKQHDLHDFMRQIQNEVAAEYGRIRKRSIEDPGTAGDQGEENWAEILREWLPRSFEVVTKGRIISHDGLTSPQIDVLVLSGEYPKKLLNKKLYLAAGVVAAFECKTTLRAEHIGDAIKRCCEIKSLYTTRIGSPYRELHAPIVYGLLAHSHIWKAAQSAPESNIEQRIREDDLAVVLHPRFQMDLLCVADLATWASSKVAFVGTPKGADGRGVEAKVCYERVMTSAFIGYGQNNRSQVEHFTAVGSLISNLMRKIAWEREALRELADYFRLANVSGSGHGVMRNWPSSVYSHEIRQRVLSGSLSNGKAWDEWSIALY